MKQIVDSPAAVLANIAKDWLPDGSHRVFSASEGGLVRVRSYGSASLRTPQFAREKVCHLRQL
jgi:hypothetical protein